MKIPPHKLARYFEILELEPHASYSQVKHAYLRLKKLYSTETPIIAPISGDFSKRKRNAILRRIETAHTKLLAVMDQDKGGAKAQGGEPREPKEAKEARLTPPAAAEKFTGPILRSIRLKLGIQLFDLSLETKIRKELLKAIEGEKFEELPSEIYLRAHMKNYARFLGLNPKKVTDDYIERFTIWQNNRRD